MPLVDMQAWRAERGIPEPRATQAQQQARHAPPAAAHDEAALLRAQIEAAEQTIAYQTDLIRQLQAALRAEIAKHPPAPPPPAPFASTGRVIRRPRPQKKEK